MSEWRVHPAFIDYSISDCGEVKRITSKKGATVGRILKPATTPFGYKVVNVSGKMKFVHVLMLEAFVGPRQKGFEARHIDDIKANNSLANLCWGTHADNYADRIRNGGGNQGNRHGMAKLNDESVNAIRRIYSEGDITQLALGKKYGVSRRCIGKVVNRCGWTHI